MGATVPPILQSLSGSMYAITPAAPGARKVAAVNAAGTAWELLEVLPAVTHLRTAFPADIATGGGYEPAVGLSYTHADGTGGAQTKITANAAGNERGGLVEMQGRTNLTTPILINAADKKVRIHSSAAGFMQSGASVEGDYGQKFKCMSAIDAVVINSVGGGTFVLNAEFDGVYFDGGSVALPTPTGGQVEADEAQAGIRLRNLSDHTIIRNCNFRNFTYGIYSENSDAVLIENVQCVEVVRPIRFDGIASRITHCQLDDCYWGITMTGTCNHFVNNTVWRCQMKTSRRRRLERRRRRFGSARHA